MRERAWRWFGIASLALGLGACVEPDADRYTDAPVDPIPAVAELAIDRGGVVSLEPGAGIGVSVEYTEGGRWSVTTTCDTDQSGLSCAYDVVVSTDERSPITGFDALGLIEDADDVRFLDDFALAADLVTSEDTDGFGFTTSPGATVRVSALLYDPEFDFGFDWSDDPRFISWVGNGAVHQGAPTNPVDLTPDRP